MEEKTNKFHALQLFTDTFAAETVHLTNTQVGIYIRLLCFAWTKNTKPFTTTSAYRICQCIDDDCQITVDEILEEFFQIAGGNSKDSWTHKRLVKEYEYLTAKYNKRSKAGKLGMEVRYNGVNNKTITPIPIPKPIPNKNIYDQPFEELWSSLNIKRGSKFKAYQIISKVVEEMPDIKTTADIYNKQMQGIEDKFVPHFSTWLFQKRWEIDEKDQKHQESPANLRTKMEKLGYNFRHSEDHFDYFKKDGKEYKIDRYDKEHIIHNVE